MFYDTLRFHEVRTFPNSTKLVWKRGRGDPSRPLTTFSKLWLGKPNLKAKAESKNGNLSCAPKKH